MNDVDEPLEPRRVRRRLGELGETPQVEFGRIPGISREGLTEAAVLIALTELDGQLHAVFTKRSDSMREHSGEISFPGGRRERQDEELRHTALREAHEEIDLAEADVNLFGNLVCIPTVTGYVVSAFVGEFEQPYELRPDPGEIDTLFLAPLNALADPDQHRLEERTWQGMSFELHFFDYEGHVIWGATGYMLHLLLDFLGKSPGETTSIG